jgi:beta-glucosidase/6-phospho-beta-glucosidase/beta-galactosidase
VLPRGHGPVNAQGLDYYDRVVDALLAKRIAPFITLFHWDMPQTLEESIGGFAGRDCADYFADYAEVVVKRLGDRATNWITLNEPWEHACFDHEQVIDELPYTVSGREIFPDGLYDCLLRIKLDYGNPLIYITENGAAFTDVVEYDRVRDPLRVMYLDSYMTAAQRAILAGANLHGYCIWTLMDNFEWQEGYGKRFGLVHVDHTTQQRTIKDSGYWVRDMIRNQAER